MNLAHSTPHIGVLIILVSILCWKGPVKASFTSTPGSKRYFKVGESVSLRWTYDPSIGADFVAFTKLNPAMNLFEDLVKYNIPTTTLTVYIDQSRLDMYDQATFRINHTTANDAGTYKCVMFGRPFGMIQSTIELTVQEESSSSSIKTSTSNSPSTILSSSSSSSSSLKASTTPLTSYISLIGSPTTLNQIPSTTSSYVQSSQLSSPVSSAVGLISSSQKSMSSSKYISTVSSVAESSTSAVTSTSSARVESSNAAKISTSVSEAIHRATTASLATTNGISPQSSYHESLKFSQKHSSAFTVSTSNDVTQSEITASTSSDFFHTARKSGSSTAFYNHISSIYVLKEQWSANTVKVNTSYLLNASTKLKSKNPLPSAVQVSKYIDSNNVTMNRRNSAAQARETLALALGIPAGIFILVVTIAAAVLFKKRLARNGRASPSYAVDSPQELHDLHEKH